MPSKSFPFALLSVFLLLFCVPTQIFGVRQISDSERESWSLSMLEGLRFVHCQDEYLHQGIIRRDERTQLDWMGKQKHCFGDVNKHFSLPNRFFRQLKDKINAWNANVMVLVRKVLNLDKDTQLDTLQTCAKNRNCYQSRILNAIWMIFRAQNITIAQYFLDKFLNINDPKKFGKIIRILEKKGMVFDMIRYEKKMEAIEADLESINSQLEEKFKYFVKKNEGTSRRQTTGKSEYHIEYSYENYLNSIDKIKNELAKVELAWTENEQKMANQFWTNDKRPVVLQTLWLVRHGEREDNINRNWGKDKSELEREDSPLSTRGIRQADELGKWFAPIKVDKLYASPLIRCLETANGLIGGEKDQRGIYINLEPGLTEFYSTTIKLGFEEVVHSKKQFALIDSNYWPIFSKRQLSLMESERQTRDRTPNDHDFVTEQTIRHILENNKEAENIVLVSHMANIGLLLELLGAEWAAVGQSSISKLNKYEQNVATTTDVLQQFRLEYTSGITHLTEHFGLNAQ